jgi:hypothetical protein
MEPAMDSTQKGFRRMRRISSRNINWKQISQRNSTDLSRTMVVLNQHVNHVKASTKIRRAVSLLLGTLFDEKA